MILKFDSFYIQLIPQLTMNQQSKTSKLLQRSMLKSLLPSVCANNEWNRWITQLGRISTIVSEKKQTKDKKAKCIECDRAYDNFLLYILHLELVHKNKIEVIKYEFSADALTIVTRAKGAISSNNSGDSYYNNDNTSEGYLMFSHKERMRLILTSIFSKFAKKVQNYRKEYFHSIDIFREVRAESEDEDSEEEIGNIERELQKMRISDFTDVNENDKVFFMKWNEAVHDSKRVNVYLNAEAMRELIDRFAKTVKGIGLRRVNLLMHAWTLWSAGRIESDDVIFLLKAYDDAPS